MPCHKFRLAYPVTHNPNWNAVNVLDNCFFSLAIFFWKISSFNLTFPQLSVKSISSVIFFVTIMPNNELIYCLLIAYFSAYSSIPFNCVLSLYNSNTYFTNVSERYLFMDMRKSRIFKLS